jgi:HSP20 family molecular chaperone IbpA
MTTTEKAIERSTSNTLPMQQPVQHEAPVSRWYYRPYADVFETDQEYTLILDMPGVAPGASAGPAARGSR